MSKLLIMSFLLVSISGCGADPLTRSECKEVLLKSAELFADYDSRNTKFKADLDKKLKMTNEEFGVEMSEELNQCQDNWDKSDYKCIFESTKLTDMKKCDLAFN